MVRLTLVRTTEVTINCKPTTCSPCTYLTWRMAEPAPFPKPGKAWCGIFGTDLAWPETVGEIERLPECLKFDGPEGTEVRVGSNEVACVRTAPVVRPTQED